MIGFELHFQTRNAGTYFLLHSVDLIPGTVVSIWSNFSFCFILFYFILTFFEEKMQQTLNITEL